VDVREGQFPGSNYAGIECLDGENKVVGRFKTTDITGYAVHEERATSVPSPFS
jgi:hypothetical protein